jgi:hypothetical protein
MSEAVHKKQGLEEDWMSTDSKVGDEAVLPETAAVACPLDTPLTGRVPGLLAIAAIPAAILVNPLFYGLAGGLLATISVLLSPARCRCLGVVGVMGAVAGGLLGALFVR